MTFDNRGQGMSTRGPQDATVADYLADLEELVDQLQLEEFVLVGPTFGGHMAAHYAALHPERVRALVLVGRRISMQRFVFRQDSSQTDALDQLGVRQVVHNLTR